jgi:hypothetical protein
MDLLNRDAILQVSDLKTEVVMVPEWGGSVMVRGMTGAERDAFEKSVLVRKGKNTEVNMANARAKLVALTVVDETGKRLFNDADVAALGQKSASALDRIFSVAGRLSGITDEDVHELTEEIKASPFDALRSD